MFFLNKNDKHLEFLHLIGPSYGIPNILGIFFPPKPVQKFYLGM